MFACRRKSLQKLQEHCRELREELLELSRKFTATYRGCRYPHLLPKSTTGSYEMALAQLRSMQEALVVQEQSGQIQQVRSLAEFWQLKTSSYECRPVKILTFSNSPACIMK